MDPNSIRVFLGSAGAAGGSSGLEGFQVTGYGSGGLWAQGDGSGNVYVANKDEYLKLNSSYVIQWQKTKPDFYSSTHQGEIAQIAVSNNGSYVALWGRGGGQGWSGTSSSSRMAIVDINPSTGAPIRGYEVSTANWNDGEKLVYPKDMYVTDNGRCTAVGSIRRIFYTPGMEYVRLTCLLGSTSMFARGYQNTPHSERWDNVDGDDAYVFMSGMDQSIPQAGYTQYNWSLFVASSDTAYFSKTYQSNSGNGVEGEGVAWDGTNLKGYAGYRDSPTGCKGIMIFENTSASSKSYYPFRISSDGDIQILKVTCKPAASNGTIAYFCGRSTISGATGSGSQLVIGAINHSGQIQWANYLNHTPSSNYAYVYRFRYNAGQDCVDISGNFGSTDAFFFKIPIDGTGEGTMGDWEYVATTVTRAGNTPSWYNGTPSLSGWANSVFASGSVSNATGMSINTTYP